MRLNIEAITITRTAEGSYVNGRYVPGANLVETAEGNVQPLTGKELQQLSEGDHERQVLKIYTAYALENGDIVTRADGVDYEVQAVEDWTAFSLPHFKARLMRVQDQ